MKVLDLVNGNKFRSAVALIASEIFGGEIDKVLPIAAVSEVIHTSIIIQDDIGDGDEIRRGLESAWRHYGTCYALFSSTYVISECLRMLKHLRSKYKKQIISGFFRNYKAVSKGQILQTQLDITDDINYNVFRHIHLNKTAIGKWSICSVSMFYDNKEYTHSLQKFTQELGDAGTIKNDIESFLNENTYEPFCSDIKNGIVTYPIYSYYHRCSRDEQKYFMSIFGKGQDADFLSIRQKVFEKEVIDDCKVKIKICVEKAIKEIENIPSSKPKDMLVAWAIQHAAL